VSEAARYTNNRLPFTKDDILYLYTDGVTEADNVKEELYGEERLKNCMESNYKLPPEDLLRKIREDIDSFADEAEQFDDITMVVLKMHAEAAEVME
jgi:sigma-B regulation protein RsbU (phosphoserine phosphatase)